MIYRFATVGAVGVLTASAIVFTAGGAAAAHPSECAEAAVVMAQFAPDDDGGLAGDIGKSDVNGEDGDGKGGDGKGKGKGRGKGGGKGKGKGNGDADSEMPSAGSSGGMNFGAEN
ncbi:hypothetical protein [Nocardia sp. NBC_00403]|uniref:hypothetical protein n=1 Tax=Nocardia sp. NBC_00403 TaxID=2975990 RepID=UPI002E1C027D